ncbi:hypothetical protein [Chryseobacterium lathyri]|uniref:Bacteriocin n=1 Tax=Chryseobacterium lathyri TaxID=395933 RepID=A0ABT9SLV8_9FLAO|nr:hypothetical protein [Chryseobacterium lathyri]MDP9960419.1 hypothetical protein [Chryseobacterium lathyri]
MKNMKKLKKAELKVIKGGIVPLGCNNWDTRRRCCTSWDEEHMYNPICPEI